MRSPLAHLFGERGCRVAIVLGSGLSDVARRLVAADPTPYSRIEGVPVSRVPGHEGALYLGDVEGTPSAVFAGRVHLYQGHDADAVTFAVRAAVQHGCGTVILTNAAGAISSHLDVGHPCLISDHLNLTGTNPLIGNVDESAFLDLSNVYDAELRAIAKETEPGLQEGVYAGLVGPVYETPAEVGMLRTLGADLVGMSTVLEAIAARHLGARVLGISLVSNLAAGITDAPLSHEEVTSAGRRGGRLLERLLRAVCSRL